MTSLAVLVDGSACAWGAFAEAKREKPGMEKEVLTRAFRSIVTFSNVHLSLAQSNQLLLYAYGNGMSKKLLYDSVRSDNPDSSSCIIKGIRGALRENSTSGDARKCGVLAATLATAICQIRKAATLGTNKSEETISGQKGRIVIISLLPDFGSQHSLLMNLFFSAHKHDICIDVVSLGGSSALLQQAADITAGVFQVIHKIEDLPRILMTRCLPVSIRDSTSFTTVDYRAACVCHEKLVSNGWTCSVCLAVLCSFMAICPSCGAVFKITVPRRKRKRPTEVGAAPSPRP
ncbi:gtf-2H3 [Pristionchus pacificus]|uniref:General transcription factor IIH subunit 3 n=1 Tax=Pristionchus pacificus TaxID=54126 RepID=A0A8R1Z6E3_PRIPA|nr:gtf-2H3 [Pristionchus pacificus]